MDKEIYIGKKINILSHGVHRKIAKEASKYGLTGVQARILGFLNREAKIRSIFQKDIEEELDTRRSSVTSVLQLMEKNGYIERVSVCEDARLKKIILTDKGTEIQGKVYSYILEFEKSLKDELSNEELEILTELIDRLMKKIAD